MSEQKVYRPMELVMQGRHNEPVYIKSEADKVIANRDYEIKKLKDLLNKLLNAKTEQIMQEVMQKTLIYGEGFVPVEYAIKFVVEIRHNKYKRCLTLHEYCLCELELAFRDPCIERSTKGCVRWRKWANHWLELAEKFKE